MARTHDNQLTVAELIQLLQKVPQDLEVELEGCDCVGWCEGVATLPDTKRGYQYVVLTRGGRTQTDAYKLRRNTLTLFTKRSLARGEPTHSRTDHVEEWFDYLEQK